MVIVDEACWGRMHKEIKVKITDIQNLTYENIKKPESYTKLEKILLFAIINTPNHLLAGLRQEKLNYGDINLAIEYVVKVLRAYRKEVRTTPSKGEQTIISQLKQFRGGTAIKVLKLLKALENEFLLTRKNGELNAITYNKEKSRFSVFTKHSHNICSLTPVLLLDATASLMINEAIWGELKEYKEVRVKRNLYTIQVVRKGFSKQSISGVSVFGEPLNEQHARESKVLREQLIQFVNSHDGKKVLVILPKGLRNNEEIKFKNSIEPHLNENVTCTHYLALKGRNDWKGHDIAIVLSREQPNPSDIEKIARAFFAGDKEPIQSIERYNAEERGLLKRDGSVEIVKVDIHPDNRCNAFLEQIREAEVIQGVDRIRSVRAENQKTAYMLTPVVTDIIADRTQKWQHTHKPHRLAQAVELAMEAGCVMPISAGELHRIWPDIWSTKDKAKHDIKHHGIKWVETQIEYYMGNHPFNHIQYWRKNQRGKPCKAIISATIPADKIKTELEKIVGEIARFKIIPSTKEVATKHVA